MRLLVCGSRKWKKASVIHRELQDLANRRDITVVIHGDAPGADRIADRIAKLIGLTVDPYPADWIKLGHKAGPIRNSKMLKVLLEGPTNEPRMVLAFHRDISRSSGTKDMVEKASNAGIYVKIVKE